MMMWHEGEGEVNANVFTSCVSNYVENEINCDKEVIIYSDGHVSISDVILL